ncbi:ACP phosphodiesterase [Aliikangiella coralliicola]|uniref:DUF479 domain-containing protein n=1 Tax=Aliikangiella coralliicola TaxID=2592383 RepID=A0A545UC62_9GAMM|nr:ACP phosphodiesterase [Aliikangiella coralliicola]TQV87052.1 DUF479 domain-containing protein [Aliikangiella coralliicola]
MNYLAHLYLADISNTSLVGNFLGDFVRGRLEQTDLSPEYKLGVRLHRKIDVFTDSHKIVQKSRTRISSGRRRYAGIIVDMAYDHFLARNWKLFSNKPLNQFVQDFHESLQQDLALLPLNSRQIVPHLIQGNWLENYQSISGISYGLNGIGKRFQRRFNRENNLNNSVEEIISNKNELERDFFDFFPELGKFSKDTTTLIKN